jgi:acyl-ACP thioesterase
MRCYGLEADGEPVARAISVWALLDTDTRALVKASDFDLPLPCLAPIDLALEHIRLPKAMTEVGRYGVHYGDVDRNMHMNNTKYPDMFANFLPMKGKMIRRISINYRSEAPIGESLAVHMANEGDTYYFRTQKRDNSINCEAKLELIDIR